MVICNYASIPLAINLASIYGEDVQTVIVTECDYRHATISTYRRIDKHHNKLTHHMDRAWQQVGMVECCASFERVETSVYNKALEILNSFREFAQKPKLSNDEASILRIIVGKSVHDATASWQQPLVATIPLLSFLPDAKDRFEFQKFSEALPGELMRTMENTLLRASFRFKSASSCLHLEFLHKDVNELWLSPLAHDLKRSVDRAQQSFTGEIIIVVTGCYLLEEALKRRLHSLAQGWVADIFIPGRYILRHTREETMVERNRSSLSTEFIMNDPQSKSESARIKWLNAESVKIIGPINPSTLVRCCWRVLQ